MITLGPSRQEFRGLLNDLGWSVPPGTRVKEALAEYKYEMMAGAWLAVTRAYSWRPEKPVRIGCCVLGHSKRKGFNAAFIGANNTPRPLSDEEKSFFKPCAEKYAILDCIKAGYIPLGAWIWTEHNQPDEVTGLQTDSLCCCSNCMGWMNAIHLPPWFFIGSARTRLPTDPPSDRWWFEGGLTLDDLDGMHTRSLERKGR